MTSLLLRRNLTRSFWHESNGNYLLFPSVLRSLVLRSLLDRRWRRRRPDPDFLSPSQGTRTLQPQAPSIRIRMPLPASCYIPPPSPWVWPGRGPAVDATMVLRLLRFRLALLDLLDLQAFSHDLPQWDLPLFLHLQCLLLISKRPLLPPCAFEDFFRVPAWTLSLLCWRSKTLGPSPRDQPRRWSKGGRRSLWWTWETVGSSS